MNTDDIRTLWAFDRWANQRLLSAALALSPEEFSRDLRVSFVSVQGTLLHILAGEWKWLRFLRGDELPKDPGLAAFPDAASFESSWSRLDKEFGAFIAGLTDQALVATREVGGRQYALSALIQHVVNHSTYHRGQVASLLRQLGHTPPATDFRLFLSDVG